MASDYDIHYMRSALNFARRGLGRVAPNPSVGCVIVKDGVVLGCGRTAEHGRPHAEAVALEQAGEAARGATAYVTLEPCAVHGRDGPCAEALIRAEIARVVVACLDINPAVYGLGVEKMKKAGIEVECGVLEEEAREMHRGFFLRFEEDRPRVTLKCACTLDGKMACETGESQWITGAFARRHGHVMRARHDAILVGIETVLSDDPMLTPRLGKKNPALRSRVVLDSDLRLPLESALVRTAKEIPLLVFHNSRDSARIAALEDAGARLVHHDPRDLRGVLRHLKAFHVTRLLVEGGGQVHASFIKAEFCDELLVYRAGTLLGKEARDAVGSLDVASLAQRYDFTRTRLQKIGDDVLEIYKPKRED